MRTWLSQKKTQKPEVKEQNQDALEAFSEEKVGLGELSGKIWS